VTSDQPNDLGAGLRGGGTSPETRSSGPPAVNMNPSSQTIAYAFDHTSITKEREIRGSKTLLNEAQLQSSKATAGKKAGKTRRQA